MYLLGILLHPDNADIPFPLVFTGPPCASDYFKQMDAFIGATLGKSAQSRYQIIINDPVQVARAMQEGFDQVRDFRRLSNDAYYFNWLLKIDSAFQQPFVPSHENMRDLALNGDQQSHALAANLRSFFSGVVAGNLKDEGIRSIEQHGPYEVRGDAKMLAALDTLLASFVASERMKLPGEAYVPCYRIVG